MHTTRNRQAQSSRKGAKPPPPRSARDELTFMLRQGAPPPQSFPADLIVPPHRGAVITAASWPAGNVPAPVTAPASSQPAISRKAAKKAARRAAARERAQLSASQALPASQALSTSQAAEELLIVEAPAPSPVEPLATSLPPPTTSPPDSSILPHVRTEPECIAALALPPERDLQVHRSAAVEPAGEEPVLVDILPDQAAPLPMARALVPRRQGFIDVLAFVLRDSGRRLARWSSARRRADEVKDKLVKAEARLRAMEAQLAALQALQARVRQS